MADKIDVLMLTPTRGWSYYRNVRVVADTVSVGGAIFKIPPEAVHVNERGRKLVVLYSSFPLPFKPDLCSNVDVKVCALSMSAVHKYVLESLSPKLMYLIKERYVAEIYRKPRSLLYLLLMLLGVMLGVGIGLMI